MDESLTFAEFHARLGNVPLERIWAVPAPGSATEADLITRWETPPHSRCELVDGALIERCSSTWGSVILGALACRVGQFADEHDLGACFAGNLPYRLRRDLIRLPSFTFAPWEAFAGGEVPDEKLATFTPGLVVDVANDCTTAAEFDRKIREFFAAGTKLAWVIDPRAKTAKAYTSAKKFKEFDEAGTLDGGKVLPGFKLPLAQLFAVGKPRKKKPK